MDQRKVPRASNRVRGHNRDPWPGKLVLLVCVVTFGIAFLFGAAAVHAYSEADWGCRVSGRGLNQVVLDCVPGYATDHDRILFFGPIPADWEDTGVNPTFPAVTEGILIYDVEADGEANILVIFEEDPGLGLVASVYDDRDGDGSVAYRMVTQTSAEVLEAGPAVKVTAPDMWWAKDGRVNFNLDIAVKGSVNASFYNFNVFRHLIDPDGQPYVYIHVRDPNGNGRPDYEWRQIHLPLPLGSTYNRTQVMVNTEDDEKPIVGAVWWPYMGATLTDPLRFTKPSYYRSPPPIDVDWLAGRVTHVNEFVASRSGNSNYFIYSHTRLDEDKVGLADFETPFAYYDLSAGIETLPTLMIRNAYYPPRDRYLLGALSPSLNRHALNDISYVWRYPDESARHSDAIVWDYKVNLVGTHEYTSVVQVGPLSIVTEPYATLPYWVTDQTWSMGAFVADEGGRRENSEGIDVWGALLERAGHESYRYVAGETDSFELNFDALGEILPGYRGELAPRLDAPPLVYVSGIDRKLHFFQATLGLWNVDGTEQITMADLDGDGYFDHWRHSGSPTGGAGSIITQLNVAPTHLLYSGHNEIVIKHARVEPVVYQAPPPRNHEEWAALHDELSSTHKVFAAGDFAAMTEQFPGPVMRMSAAALRDYRRTEGEGFRFVLDVMPGVSIQGSDLLGGDELAPGEYLVEYQSEAFSMSPLIGAQLSLTVRQAAGHNASLPVQVTVRNNGTADQLGLSLVCDILTAGGSAETLSRKPIKALAGQTVQVLVDIPTVAAGGALFVRLEDSTARRVAAADPLVLAPARLASSDVSFRTGQGLLLLLVVLAFAALLALAAYLATVGPSR